MTIDEIPTMGNIQNKCWVGGFWGVLLVFLVVCFVCFFLVVCVFCFFLVVVLFAFLLLFLLGRGAICFCCGFFV